jgi:hypothetical protein
MKRQYYHVRETYTPDNVDAERSRVEAHFWADPDDLAGVASAALAAFDHADAADELGDDLAAVLIGDGRSDAGLAFHFDSHSNDGLYTWHVRPVLTPEECAARDAEPPKAAGKRRRKS